MILSNLLFKNSFEKLSLKHQNGKFHLGEFKNTVVKPGGWEREEAAEAGVRVMGWCRGPLEGGKGTL